MNASYPEAASGRAVLTCDLSRLAENYRLLSAALCAEGAIPYAVVKADAYGHGAIPVATALYRAGARRFAVATLCEGLALRAALPGAYLLVLGYTPPEAAPYAAEAGIALTISSLAYAKAVSRHLRGRRLRVEFKLNSGMNRAGFSLFPAERLQASVREVCAAAALPGLSAQGVFSHLAAADDPADPLTGRQVARFRAARAALAAAGLPLPGHLSATAAAVRYGALGLRFARLGLGLYGYLPPACPGPALLPVGRLTCRVVQILTPPAGERVGYGGGYRVPRGGRLGLLPIGYADGLPRACEGGLVRVDGVLCPLVGRISMDAATVLLPRGLRRRHPTVTIFGDEPADLYRLAEAAGTIPYELLARLGTRIDRKYIYENSDRTLDTE